MSERRGQTGKRERVMSGLTHAAVRGTADQHRKESSGEPEEQMDREGQESLSVKGGIRICESTREGGKGRADQADL